MSGTPPAKTNSEQALPLDCHTTVGLTAAGLPELVCYLVDRDVARGVFKAVVERLKKASPQTGKRMRGLLQSGEAALLRVFPKHLPDHFGHAVRIFGDVKAYQVVFADPNGLLPWEKACDFKYSTLQPFLGIVPGRSVH